MVKLELLLSFSKNQKFSTHLLKRIQFSIFSGVNINCDPQIISTFTTLKDLVTFFDCYHEKKYELALETLGRTKLVPLSMNDLEICVHNFKRYSGAHSLNDDDRKR